LNTSRSKSDIAGKVTNVVLEKDGEDQFDRSCEELRSVRKNQEGEEYPTHIKKKEG